MDALRPATSRSLPRPRSGGFTLIELLVVLVLIGVLAGTVVLSGGMGGRTELSYEADRLAQVLSLAREEAQVRGAPIRFEYDREGYRFSIFRDREWRGMQDDTDLKARVWAAPLELRIERPDGANSIEFGRDAVDAPFMIHLQRDQVSVALQANGLGGFEVRP